MQIATVVDVATNCYEFKVAMDKGDVNGAIAAGVAIGMAAVPGQKLIPAPLRNAVKNVVTKSAIRILNSRYGQAAVKAGGELVDAASSKVQNLANKAANSKAGQAIANSKVGKGLQNAGDRLVQHVEGTTAHQAEKDALHQAANAGKNIDLRVKPEVNTNELTKQPSKLLPNEGKIGTYKELKMSAKPGDDLSAHHMPSARFMEHHGVKKPDGISMMVQEPTPGIGGRHRLTRTYGRPAKLDETPREALARDVRDMRLIYRDEGVYTPEIHDSLKQVINKNKEKFPNLFGVKDGRN